MIPPGKSHSVRLCATFVFDRRRVLMNDWAAYVA